MTQYKNTTVQIRTYVAKTQRISSYGIKFEQLPLNNGDDHISPILRDIINSFTKEELDNGIRIEMLYSITSRPLNYGIRFIMNTCYGEFGKTDDVDISIMRILANATEQIEDHIAQPSNSTILHFKPR